MKIAVIPARGGSKRIPRKNIKVFRGKPMLAWSVEVAFAANVFDRVIVSTDDAEIAGVARQCGAEVPFLRPTELASDEAGTTEVIAHAAQWALSQGWSLKAVCCIYPAAPFIRVEDLRQGGIKLEEGDWSFVFPATDYGSTIFRAFHRGPDGGVAMFFPHNFEKRSQDLPQALHDAGQFYWGLPASWIANKRLFDRHSFALMIPRWRVQDIDVPDDWKRAELLHHLLEMRGEV